METSKRYICRFCCRHTTDVHIMADERLTNYDLIWVAVCSESAITPKCTLAPATHICYLEPPHIRFASNVNDMKMGRDDNDNDNEEQL